MNLERQAAFYNVRVGPPIPDLVKSEKKDGGKYERNLVELPLWIRKLITSIEISQSITDKKGNSRATIDFIAGSREPVTPHLRKLNALGANETGVLGDLVFSEIQEGTNVIGLPTEDDRKKGKEKRETEKKIYEMEAIVENLEAELEVSNLSKKEIKKRIEQKKAELKTLQDDFKKIKYPTFVFLEGNTVEIEFGWLYPEKQLRKVYYQIIEIATRFTIKGDSLSIVCADITSELDKYTVTDSVWFGSRRVYSKKKDGTNTQEIIKEVATNPVEILFTMADTLGYGIIISPILATYKFKKKARKWAQDQSLDEFLTQLAKELNAYYFIEYNWKINNHCIYFLSKIDYEAHIYRVYAYRNIGCPIIDINISHKEDQGKSSSASGVDPSDKKKKQPPNNKGVLSWFKSHTKGKRAGGIMFSSTQSAIAKAYNKQEKKDIEKQITELETQVDNSKDTKFNEVTRANIATLKGQAKLIGYSISGPDPVVNVRKSTEITDRAERNAIQLNMTLIGDPFLVPSTIFIDNIGLRYSGKYFVDTVSHYLGINNFRTVIKANTSKVNKEGVSIAKKETDKAQTPEAKVKVDFTGDAAKRGEIITKKIIASIDIGEMSEKSKTRLKILGTILTRDGHINPDDNKHFMNGNTEVHSWVE